MSSITGGPSAGAGGRSLVGIAAPAAASRSVSADAGHGAGPQIGEAHAVQRTGAAVAGAGGQHRHAVAHVVPARVLLGLADQLGQVRIDRCVGDDLGDARQR